MHVSISFLFFQTVVGRVGQDGVVVLLDNVLEIRRSGRERVRIPHQRMMGSIVLEITPKMLTVQVFHFLLVVFRPFKEPAINNVFDALSEQRTEYESNENSLNSKSLTLVMARKCF